ncbi:hypothetical protein [Achromobacter sp. NFACC18-2]|uniref:hypothetical protein n=1 Tax=Achromobacter sp. NFACC18-2 TaxID=1564112 RepID=UPI0008C8FB1F|nr:hypothetical protein [Achromobacter sp. NFACC18-2]SEJ99774.1 hypothetical protein SAMN03159494_04235 [Achromobacter sp. NFACC18-2]
MTKQGLIDNAQHIAGMAIGRVLRALGLRYSKEHRGSRWFSTVAANLAADGVKQSFLPYR